jgi:hypothetical protein
MKKLAYIAIWVSVIIFVFGALSASIQHVIELISIIPIGAKCK